KILPVIPVAIAVTQPRPTCPAWAALHLVILHVGIEQTLRLVEDAFLAIPEPVLHAGRRGILRDRIRRIIVLRVHQRRESELPEVALAARLPRLFTRGCEHGKENRRENRDNGDY